MPTDHSESKGPRQAIVGAAARLFRRRGYAGVGINEIVEASGAPKGSVYHYFPAKEDLFIAVAREPLALGTR